MSLIANQSPSNGLSMSQLRLLVGRSSHCRQRRQLGLRRKDVEKKAESKRYIYKLTLIRQNSLKETTILGINGFEWTEG